MNESPNTQTTSKLFLLPDLPQYEVTKAYLPRESDELGLQQAEVVVVLQAQGGKRGKLSPSLGGIAVAKYAPR